MMVYFISLSALQINEHPHAPDWSNNALQVPMLSAVSLSTTWWQISFCFSYWKWRYSLKSYPVIGIQWEENYTKV